MNTNGRTENVLLNSADRAATDAWDACEKVEVDTSCTNVPIGFVRLGHVKLLPGTTPDSFWSSCLAADRLIEPLSVRIETTYGSQIKSVFECIRQDLARVGQTGAVTLPIEVEECFTASDGCNACCGCVLLIKSAKDAFYIHWHRES